MKKLLIILVMIIIMIMELSSQEKENKLSNEQRLNNYIITFQAQKIIYNGQEGFFIPMFGYKQLMLYMNDYIYYQDLVLIKDERIKYLEKYEVMNLKLKTALGITIGLDVGSLFLCAGLGLFCYSLASK